jgi:hypothetical protein
VDRHMDTDIRPVVVTRDGQPSKTHLSTAQGVLSCRGLHLSREKKCIQSLNLGDMYVHVCMYKLIK